MEKQLTPIPTRRKKVLTSVNVDEIAFNDFKVECVRNKYSLAKLVNTCMQLYLTDESFKKYVESIEEVK